MSDHIGVLEEHMVQVRKLLDDFFESAPDREVADDAIIYLLKEWATKSDKFLYRSINVLGSICGDKKDG